MLGTCLLIAITMIALHYLPWPRLIHHRVPPTPVDKIVGVAVIWLGFIGHHKLFAGDPVITLSAITLSAGFGTIICYVLDLWLDARDDKLALAKEAAKTRKRQELGSLD